MMTTVDCLRRPLSSFLAHLRPSLIGIVVGLGLLTGCSGFSSSEEPLPDSTFTHVLTELHLAKGRYTVDAPYPKGLRDSIFARYDVRSSEFDATLEYYSRHPEAFGILYQSVIDTLQSMQSAARSTGPPDTANTRNRRAKTSP